MSIFKSADELSDKETTSSVFRDIKQCYFRYKMTPEEYLLLNYAVNQKQNGVLIYRIV